MGGCHEWSDENYVACANLNINLINELGDSSQLFTFIVCDSESEKGASRCDEIVESANFKVLDSFK